MSVLSIMAINSEMGKDTVLGPTFSGIRSCIDGNRRLISVLGDLHRKGRHFRE